MKDIIDNFWPTFIGKFHNEQHEIIKKDLICFIDEYIKLNKSRRSHENHNLFESKYDIHNSKNENIKKLVFFFKQSFAKIAMHANQKFVSTNKKKLSVNIHDMWFIKYEQGGFVLPHTHGMCSWCCVYYLQIGHDSNVENGSTFFLRPSNYPRETKDFGSKYNEGDIRKIAPTEGSMLIWPNNLSHGSLPYKGKTNRIIFSANATIYDTSDDGKVILTP